MDTTQMQAKISILVVNNHPPVRPGIRAQNYPETVTLVLTVHDRDAYLAHLMRAGAAGYLDKNIREDRLIDAIRRAAYGETLFDKKQKQRVERWRISIEKKWNAISPREKVILCQLADGLNNKTISSMETRNLEKSNE